MKKLGASLVALGALAVLAMLVAALALRPPERRYLRGDRVSELLKPLTWVKERVGLAELSFTLTGQEGFPELTLGTGLAVDRAAGEELFEFDPDRFIRAQGVATFREAQLKYFASQEFDAQEARYRRRAPHLVSWGALPYPPLRSVPKSWKRDAPAAFERSFFASSNYQARLDQITGFELTKNTELKLFQNGTAFPLFEQMATRARKFLLLNVLSMTCDSATEPLIKLFEKKAREKTDVRILIHRWFAKLDGDCLDRLKAAGVAIVKTDTHSSYLLNDQGEIAVGSQSIARMFARSTGHNFLDRDTMLWVKGPLATDGLQDFVSVWEANRSESDAESLALLSHYKKKKEQELVDGLRGPDFYRAWLSGTPRGLCRFAAQKPKKAGTSISELLISLTRQARSEIFLSGVDIGDSPVTRAVALRAKGGLAVDFLGNGWEGGNGELTMLLDEWIDDLSFRGRDRSARVLELFRDSDRRRLARDRLTRVREFASAPSYTSWAHYGFLHYKIWSFDHYGVWVGSANPDAKAHEKFYEAGAFCMDSRLAQDFAIAKALDLANSVPYPSR